MSEIQKIFREEIKRIDDQIDTVKKLDEVNTQLQKLNWVFLHPYSQGGDIYILERLSKEENASEKVMDFFAHKFLNLRSTIHFIDGFFKKRPFLKDYSASIEESVILCLQKDFRGAINTLMPVIEGTLRKYLVSKKGDSSKNVIKISELLKSIDSLTEDYVELEKTYLPLRYRESSLTIEFDINQQKQLNAKRREYFELWMKQLKNFLENNLYLDTRKTQGSDTFNRHTIFHALDDNIDFSFSNYLRLFNCIHFLSWAIGMVSKECSILSEANEQDVMNKWVDYLKVLAVSEAMTEAKSSIYGREIESFKPYLLKEHQAIIARPQGQIKEGVMILDLLKNIYQPTTKNNISISKTWKMLLFYRSIKGGIKINK